MRNYRRLWAVVTVGIVALILEFGLHQPGWAQIVITVIGALIVLLMLTGGDALEDFAATKANSDLKQLLDNTPTTAHRLVDGKQEDISVDDVNVDDTVLVKPQEVVPVDGVVIEGSSTVDEASLTGESKPVDKNPKDELMSGTVNGDSALTVRVTKRAEDSQYQGIVQLVKESEARPAHFVRMADRYALPFTVLAYVIAGVAWAVTGNPLRFAEVLVVASPCPLILAAPVAMVSGMSRTSRAGIIVKSGTALEKLSSAKTVAFDKTGTITQGVLAVNQVQVQPGYDQNQLLLLAASAEQQSTHILARSLVSEVGSGKLLGANAAEEVTAEGVQAEVAGKLIKVGKPDFAGTDANVDTTAVYVSVDGHYAGVITFTDRIRPEAKQTISALHELGVANTMMISGDNQAIADDVAQQVGVDKVFAEQLPADKIKVLDNTPKDARPVVMVGDGVNDAPSLAVADVGIAMGAHGATAASESADAVILRDDLTKVACAVIISQDTMRIAKEAVWIGIGICTGLMLIAAFGVIPVIIGAMLQEVVDTITILYALRARSGRRNADMYEPAKA